MAKSSIFKNLQCIWGLLLLLGRSKSKHQCISAKNQVQGPDATLGQPSNFHSIRCLGVHTSCAKHRKKLTKSKRLIHPMRDRVTKSWSDPSSNSTNTFSDAGNEVAPNEKGVRED